jgi:hypothetical protein
MSRTPQLHENTKGSLRWIQTAIEDHWPALNDPILAAIPGASAIEWRSPLASDAYAEYRDADFLRRLGLERLEAPLKDFWPDRGPQWDALGLTNNGQVLLVEAKAHIGELCSPGTAAGPASLARIEQRLDEVAAALGATQRPAPWTRLFYQLANRLAHLHWLRVTQGVPAWLVLVNFVGDEAMGGPKSDEAWDAAYQVAFHAMGLPRRHVLSRWIVEVCPDVRAHGSAEAPGEPRTAAVDA